jgi:hypothetical protein
MNLCRRFPMQLGRIAGHREPQQPPLFEPDNQKCEQLVKRNRRNHKEIDCRNPFHVRAQRQTLSVVRGHW